MFDFNQGSDLQETDLLETSERTSFKEEIFESLEQKLSLSEDHYITISLYLH